ncbi:hypothetical protein ACZ11_01300 [Lysinibacillus xylanilyticus]|uniref:DUF4065 domain-containing protein n=1 Tax=Lysinibacillus xylanilyticus TaxID=582475 RepID=A0A0K9FGY1_9BACI|nr:hypothetical protein [Lysinibacillus xylanilyticus]KMY33745.1 hypothetical protein ACZ11_01300 [Lysinibacillus xylanilyticus]
MKKREKILRINGDILSVFRICNEVGWESLKEISVYRIIYISSVLYSFKYPSKENPFSEDYDFVTSLRGPFTEDIKISLTNLLVNEYLVENGKQLSLGKETSNKIDDLPKYKEKYNWFEVVIYILAIYGEEKIYDFVVRDPEYQENLQTNSIKEINIEKGNKTYSNLVKLKETFERALGESANELDDKKYLEYYFDYIFSKILRGELDHEL